MLTAETIIENWRKNWKTKSKHLAIAGCGTVDDTIEIAVNKAHAPSVIRALKIPKGKSTKKPREAVEKYLVPELKEKLQKESFEFEEYDKWAHDVCEKIRTIYHEYGIEDYTFGNAQKLFNMSIKYIFSADNIDINLAIFKVAHIPVDRVIMNIAKKKLKVSPMSTSWSKTDNLEEILSYQKRFREALSEGYFPLLWECENWSN